MRVGGLTKARREIFTRPATQSPAGQPFPCHQTSIFLLLIIFITPPAAASDRNIQADTLSYLCQSHQIYFQSFSLFIVFTQPIRIAFKKKNSNFRANFINQNSFFNIRENPPKSYGMGLSPHPPTPPPYGKGTQVL